MSDEIKEILEDYSCIPRIKKLGDYITNLQEENERLKELCDKYEEEHSTAFNYWKEQLKTNKNPKLLQGKDKELLNTLTGGDKE